MFKKWGVEKAYNGFLSNKLLIAITTLVGTIVGAGVLGIPYVVAQAGILFGFVWILVLGAAFLFLNLFTGEIVLRTRGQHQLTGYAEKYLGKKGKVIMTIALLISIYGALSAYLIGTGETLRAIFHVGSPLMYSLIFFAITGFIVWNGIKATGRMELILISLLVLIVIVIGIFSLKSFSAAHFLPHNPILFFLPYGVVLFAFMGMPAVPEMKQELVKNKKQLKKAIIIGSIIPIILYIIFVVIVVGIVGIDQFSLLLPNERIATIALSVYGNHILGILANILAILAMFTSFLTLALALVGVYHLDYGRKRWLAVLLTLLVPLIIAVSGAASFILLLGITGTIAGGLEGILVQLMYWQAKKKGKRKPEYSLPKWKTLGTLFIILFVVGVVSHLYLVFS